MQKLLVTMVNDTLTSKTKLSKVVSLPFASIDRQFMQSTDSTLHPWRGIGKPFRRLS